MMNTGIRPNYDLDRFIQYHKTDYMTALNEIRNGRKTSHWIWFIFPQVQGLGHSAFSKYFGIESVAHAKAFYDKRILRSHLREITEALLSLPTNNISEVMSEIDVMKLKSSMTLFDMVCPDDIFAKVLDKYYKGERDRLTIDILERQSL